MKRTRNCFLFVSLPVLVRLSKMRTSKWFKEDKYGIRKRRVCSERFTVRWRIKQSAKAPVWVNELIGRAMQARHLQHWKLDETQSLPVAPQIPCESRPNGFYYAICVFTLISCSRLWLQLFCTFCRHCDWIIKGEDEEEENQNKNNLSFSWTLLWSFAWNGPSDRDVGHAMRPTHEFNINAPHSHTTKTYAMTSLAHAVRCSNSSFRFGTTLTCVFQWFHVASVRVR